MKNHLLRLAVIGLVVMLGTSMASAVTVDGVVYTITNITVHDANSQSVTLQIDLTNYDFSGTGFLGIVAVKISSDATAVNLTAPGGWTAVIGNASNSGLDCSGSGSGWVCAEVDSPTITDGIVTFTFQITGSGFFNDGSANIKALYLDSTGDNRIGAQVSETITTTVPEPGTLILFGSGLMGMAATRVIRRRRAQK